MLVASCFSRCRIPARADVGLKSQLFVYECGGPYGCANFAALDASSSHRCGNVFYCAFCSQIGHLRSGQSRGA